MAIAIVLKPGHLPTFPRYFLAGYFLAGYFLAGPDAGGVLRSLVPDRSRCACAACVAASLTSRCQFVPLRKRHAPTWSRWA